MRAVRMLEASASMPPATKLRAPNPKALLNDGRSSVFCSEDISSARVAEQAPSFSLAFASAECPGGIARDRGSRRHIAGDHGAGANQCLSTDPHAAENHRARPEGRAALDEGSLQLPVAIRLETPVVRGRPGQVVVDEDDPVPDEGGVSDRDALADECVALDLAVRPD